MDSHLIFLLLYSVCVFGNPCLNRQKSAFPHETDCDKYTYCKRGVPTVGQCPQGQVFDVVENKCLPKNVGKCDPKLLGNSPTPNNIKKRAAEETSQIDIRRRKLALPECHEKSTWIEGDPENCRLFYLCVIGEISRVDCPYDFVFDPSKKFCVPPTHYNCITSTTTTSTSTTTPKTTRK
ncbi:peritrophin-48-like [Helicoverpa armigera]|uniref:peritrophin-48-like n=1 Tax=Helicoverpa armigera TaxID=29058 RepID=UPI003082B980